VTLEEAEAILGPAAVARINTQPPPVVSDAQIARLAALFAVVEPQRLPDTA
jgi:hypothetical protein